MAPYSFLLILAVVIICANSARILGVFPTPSISHQVVFQPVWRELSLRGHEVIVITPNPLKDKSLINLTEIDLHDVSYAIWDSYSIATLGVTTEDKGLDSLINLYTDLTEACFDHPEVNALINDKSQKFDLVIVEHLWPSPFAFIEHFNCPAVGITSLPLSLGAHDALGNPSHPVTHPDDIFLPFSSKNIRFANRVKSLLYSIISRAMGTFVLVPKIAEKVKKHFPNGKKTIRELGRSISLTFANVNPAINTPRPNVPAVIEFTGIHLRPRKALPEDLQKILDDSKNGVIYLSFGSNIKSSQLPKDKIQLILETLSDLPFTVLWKFEDELKNKPDNVVIRKWLPQQDILRHKNVKLFITQGGLQSLDEAINYAIPVVVIPFFGDQPSNANKILDAGLGLSITFASLNIPEFKSTIMKVINNKQYKETAKKLSNIAKDQPVSALEKVIWWTEYVIRHKGAYHLRSPAVELPSYQYFMLDVIGFLIVSVVTVLYVFYKLTKLLLTCTHIL